MTIWFAVEQVRSKALEHAQVRPAQLQQYFVRTVPTLLDVLEPTREGTSAPVEAHKVGQI